MKTKTILVLIASVVLSFQMNAQDNSYNDYLKNRQKQISHYRDSVMNDYKEFRQKANAEYARFMKDRWEAFGVTKATPVPELPEPVKPYTRPKEDNDLGKTKLPLKKITELPKPKTEPIKPVDRKPVEVPRSPKTEFSFSFYNTPCKVHVGNGMKIKLGDINEKNIAEAWEQIAAADDDALLSDLLSLKQSMNLCDWAYIRILKDFTEAYYGKSCNEAVLLQTYLLAQSGYALRMASSDNKLILSMPFDGQVYRLRSINIDGTRFYMLNADDNCESLRVFNKSFSDNEHTASLRIDGMPKLKNDPSPARKLQSLREPAVEVSLSVNKNLVAFLNDYPQHQWKYYAWAGLSDETKASLYPALRGWINGVGQVEAASRLINFVQMAFDYKTDHEQFGYERTLFADESLFYPYCDCEDRAVLFSVLVRDLLGLEVVLLDYPDHIATAVRFTEPTEGDYFNVGSDRYVICDPTYLGANVGMCMPKLRSVPANIHKL